MTFSSYIAMMLSVAVLGALARPVPAVGAVYRESFDAGAHWYGGAMGSYSADKTYVRPGAPAVFGGDVEALRQTAADQAGVPATRGGGGFAWRLRNAGTGAWTATIASGGVGAFAVWVRRWDPSPEPQYVCEVSRDNGRTFVPVQSIDNAWLGGNGWRRISATLNIDNGSGADDAIVIRIRRIGGERLLVDDFAMTAFGSPEPLPEVDEEVAGLGVEPGPPRIVSSGTATIDIQPPGALPGRAVFVSGQSGQSLRITLRGVADRVIDEVALELPPGWSGWDENPPRIEGEGFAGARLELACGTLTVHDAQLTANHSGVITLPNLTSREHRGPSDSGRDDWVLRTRVAGSERAEIESLPRTWITVPIAHIREVDGSGVPRHLTAEVAIEGVVTAPAGVFATNMTLAFLQDDTGGVAIYSRRPGLLDRPGRYRVYGDVIHFNGLTEVQPPRGAADTLWLGEAPIPAPLPVRIGEILRRPEALEGRLVRVENLVITGGAWPGPGASVNVTVSDDCGVTTMGLRVFADTGIGAHPAPTEPFALVAIVGQNANRAPYTGGYQLMPRGPADIIPGDPLAAPVALDRGPVNPDRFEAAWSAVPGAAFYRLDVSPYPDFQAPGLKATRLAEHPGQWGHEAWTERDLSAGEAGGRPYLVLTTAQAAVISPPMDFRDTRGQTLEFAARTYGPTNAGQAAVAVAVSSDDGATWIPVATRTPEDARLTPMLSVDLSRFDGPAVRVRLATPAAGAKGGVGLSAIAVHAQRATDWPVFVPGYNDLIVTGTDHIVTGLAPGQVFYYRVRAAVCSGAAGPFSKTAVGETRED